MAETILNPTPWRTKITWAWENSSRFLVIARCLRTKEKESLLFGASILKTGPAFPMLNGYYTLSYFKLCIIEVTVDPLL